MTATPASKRILRRLDDLQASLGTVMVDINRLEEAVRAIVDLWEKNCEVTTSLHNRIEALERSDG